ncbi:MAG: hypothetical protein ACRDD9_00765, partial [Shewanella sp.]
MNLQNIKLRDLALVIFAVALTVLPLFKNNEVFPVTLQAAYCSISLFSLIIGLQLFKMLNKYHLLIIPFTYLWISIFSTGIYLFIELFASNESIIMQNIKLSRSY